MELIHSTRTGAGERSTLLHSPQLFIEINLRRAYFIARNSFIAGSAREGNGFLMEAPSSLNSNGLLSSVRAVPCRAVRSESRQLGNLFRNS